MDTQGRVKPLDTLYVLVITGIPWHQGRPIYSYFSRLGDATRRMAQWEKSWEKSQNKPKYELLKAVVTHSPIPPCGKTHKKGWRCGLLEGHPGKCAEADVDQE